MELFDFCLYAAAIITVLLLRAERPTATVAPQPEAQPQPQPIEVNPEPQPIAQPAPAMAATIAPPVVSLTIPTEAPKGTEAPADLASLTSAELRRRCQSAGIRWRNAHGKGKHLSKGEMIAALA